MTRIPIILSILLLLLAAPGCQEKEHDPGVTAAYKAFIGAVKARDAGKLWELSPAELRTRFDALQGQLAAVTKRVQKEYPTSDREATLTSLGSAEVRAATNGKELFLALVDFDALGQGDAVDRGLEIDEIGISGTEATVTTRGGEGFLFVRDGDEWRCTTLVTQLEQYSSLQRLKANIKVATANMDRWSKVTRETTDPRRADGALNTVAEAVKGKDLLLVHKMLDKPSKEHLAAGYKVVAKLQAALEKRFKRPERKAWLTPRKIDWIEKVGDAKALFVLLHEQGRLADALPDANDMVVGRIERIDKRITRIHVTTGAGPRVHTMVRRESGLWALSIPAILQREAFRAMEAELRAVPQ